MLPKGNYIEGENTGDPPLSAGILACGQNGQARMPGLKK